MEKEQVSENGRPQTEVDINADENVSGSTHLNEPVTQEDPVALLKAEIVELKDKYIRQAAEFDNYRKRSSRERIEYMQSAGKEVIAALLDVLDDMDRAEKELQHKEGNQGVTLVFNKLRTILYGKGLKPMESIGKEFNTEFHEAITQIDVADENLKGKVIEEVHKGYYLNDKILRHAKVVVGK